MSHYNATPAIDIFGSVQDADLGYVSAQINRIIADAEKDLPKGSHVVLRGQAQTMKASFAGLLIDLVGAVVLVYMLIVVNFQSLLDPFIIITALPALEVATNENASLQAQLSNVSIQARRMNASVLLVKAPGGGWKTGNFEAASR